MHLIISVIFCVCEYFPNHLNIIILIFDDNPDWGTILQGNMSIDVFARS